MAFSSNSSGGGFTSRDWSNRTFLNQVNLQLLAEHSVGPDGKSFCVDVIRMMMNQIGF